MLHSWEHLVGEDIPTLSPDVTHYEIYRQVVGPFFNYAALYVVGISFFLWGLKNAKLKSSKVLVFALGVIGLQLTDAEAWRSGESWTWEVYGFLLVAVLLCRFLPNKRWVSGAVIASAVVMLSVSLNEWMPLAALTAEPLRTILFAELNSGEGVVGWFLIPWIFFPLMLFSLGRLAADWSLNLSYAKAFVLTIPLVALGSILGGTKPPPVEPLLGPHFYQFLFMQTSSHFWHHFSIFMAIVIWGLTLEHRFPALFTRFAWLEKLQWNRNFFFCYFIHFGWIAIFMNHREAILAKPFYIDFIWIGVFLLTELLVQWLAVAIRFYKWIFRRTFASAARPT